MQQKKNVLFVMILTTLFGLSACTTTEDPVDNSVKTPGSLAVSVTTSTYNGQYAPSNVVAVWIESNSGTFVKTLMVKGSRYRSHLTNWTSASGNTTDAITGATAQSHGTYSLIWNGKDVNGSDVGDGTYNVCVEFTESNSGVKYAEFSFAKGTTADTQSPSAKSNISNVSIKWTPAATL